MAVTTKINTTMFMEMFESQYFVGNIKIMLKSYKDVSNKNKRKRSADNASGRNYNWMVSVMRVIGLCFVH